MRSVTYIACCSIFAVFVVITLYALSAKTTRIKNNFERSFLSSNTLDSERVLDLKYNGYYIAGLDEEQIYLSNFYAPERLLVSNYTLSETKSVQLVVDDEKLALESIEITIDSPNVFISEKTTSTILHGTMSNFQYARSNLRKIGFNKSLPITSTNFLLRTYDSKLQQNILRKVSINSQSRKDVSFVLEKQVDGIFCTDGMLLYNEDLEQIIYVYRFRNQFVVLDTMLNVIFRGNTIDTISHADIKTQKVPSENKIMLTSKPLEVNKLCAVYKNQLYINSGIIADNEQKSQLDQNSVIDVYSLKDQQYQFSFYLPDYNSKKMYDFKVVGNNLVALYEHYLVIYTLNTNDLDGRNLLIKNTNRSG